MACDSPCSCCHGACCNGATCSQKSCLTCEADGGTWQGVGVACDPNPCPVECVLNEDCCPDGAKVRVPPCTDPANPFRCCPEGSAAWVDDPGDPRYGNCVTACDGGTISGGGGDTAYCCNGVCQAEPCDTCDCTNPCWFTGTSTATEWGRTAEAVVVPDGCESCTPEVAEDAEDNPNRPGDQSGSGPGNGLAAIVNWGGVVAGWSFGATARESYVVPSAGGFTSDYEEYKITSYAAVFSCDVVDSVAEWTGTFSFSYSHSILNSPGGVPQKYQNTIRDCQVVVTFSDECPNPCPISASLSPAEVTVNEVTGAFACATDTEECVEYDAEGNETPCTDYLNSPMNNATFTLACRAECEGVAPMALSHGPGTELKALLSRVGITSTPNCKCNARASEMDTKGCDWCAENIDLISSWLQEEAERRGLPYIKSAGKLLINIAIRRARQKGNSR